MTRTLCVAIVLALAGCAPLPTPIVERPNTTTAQTNRDMAECRNNPPTFAWGNPVENCMKARGYTILNRY